MFFCITYETTYKCFGRRGKDEGDKKCLEFPAEIGMQIGSQAATLTVTWLHWWETPNAAVVITKKINKLNCIWRCAVRVMRQDAGQK